MDYIVKQEEMWSSFQVCLKILSSFVEKFVTELAGMGMLYNMALPRTLHIFYNIPYIATRKRGTAVLAQKSRLFHHPRLLIFIPSVFASLQGLQFLKPQPHTFQLQQHIG